MRLRGVGRRYGLAGPWVLRGVDLDVPPGSLTRVEGTNGSGKSTLLRLLAGIDAPTSGRITDRPRTAYVPERFPAELPFSVLGYLTHLGRIHGLGRAEAVRGAGEWLERFGAAEYAATPLAELSKGTSQKVAVAQALLAAPALLVLDEAWTGLDRAARGVLDEAVAERIADGAAVVFVDHDPRRLAGSPDAVFRVTETRLEPTPVSVPVPASASASASAPTPASASAPVPAPVPATGPLPDPGEPPVTAGRRVRIEAEPSPGATLPPNLPGTPLHEPIPPPPNPGGEAARVGQAAPGPGDTVRPAVEHDRAVQGASGARDEAGSGGWGAPGGDPGPVRLIVGGGDSDALLRVLLTASPPWHIRAVTEIPADPEAA
ncbi:ATP-binding cassette domain-containing protein [Streptomyces sp. NPDC005962]|uniref:ABC transporter ATP-binding protein n=1 Tax=Streptomyces sp. NPDC005962 TaxID=3154466 RepID=UPI0033E3ABD2